MSNKEFNKKVNRTVTLFIIGMIVIKSIDLYLTYKKNKRK
jgi:hypothetical protein